MSPVKLSSRASSFLALKLLSIPTSFMRSTIEVCQFSFSAFFCAMSFKTASTSACGAAAAGYPGLAGADESVAALDVEGAVACVTAG